MTYLERLKTEYPEKINESCRGGAVGCPYNYKYEPAPYCAHIGEDCTACWNREMPETEAEDEETRRKKKIEELYAWCGKTPGCEECSINDLRGRGELCEFEKRHEDQLDEFLEAIRCVGEKTEPEAHAIEDVAKATPNFERINETESYTQTAMHYRHNGLAPDLQLFHGALGLAGESGEVCDLIKKYAFQGHPLEEDKLVEELGDTLWYLAHIASTIGITLAEIMDRNIAKLVARYPNGRFEVERSISREEEAK